jgi:hypothetical protein
MFFNGVKKCSAAVPIKDQAIELGNHPSMRPFSLKELDLATNHFKDWIGEGSFGPVFLGRLADGSEVAIKRRADTSKRGTDSFLNEVRLSFPPALFPLVG